MAAKITVVGSSNTDMIVKAERIPRPGETILGGAFSTAAGGKGANQAVGAARAGGAVSLVARVGDDLFGEEALKGFTKDGINVSHIRRDTSAASGVALILIDANAENSIAVASGANANLSPDDALSAKEIIADSDILLMQLEVPIETVEKAADIACQSNVRVILNPAPARELDDALLSKCSILTPNETEAELLTGVTVETEADAQKASAILRARGVDTVMITLGVRGVYVSGDDFEGMVQGFSVEAVDTTAAGDVFNGALAVALAEGMPVKEAVQFSNAAAALSVTKLGAQPSAPQRNEIESMLNR